jgi:hypothetical protein
MVAVAAAVTIRHDYCRSGAAVWLRLAVAPGWFDDAQAAMH